MKLFGDKKDTSDYPAPEAGPAETPKSGLFSRMKQAVSRTRESLSARIEAVVALTRTVDESTLDESGNGAADQRPGRANHHRHPRRPTRPRPPPGHRRRR